MEFNSGKYKESVPSFLTWLLNQTRRDDLIGDISIDVKIEVNRGIIPITATFEVIFDHVNESIDHTDFNIHFPNDSGFEGFKREIGREPQKGFRPKIEPFVMLKISLG